MGQYTVAAGERGVYERTLTADTVDVVTFGGGIGGFELRVISDGSAPIFFTLDGSDPQVGDAHAYYLPAMPVVAEELELSPGANEVRLVSPGTPKYSVVRA